MRFKQFDYIGCHSITPACVGDNEAHQCDQHHHQTAASATATIMTCSGLIVPMSRDIDALCGCQLENTAPAICTASHSCAPGDRCPVLVGWRGIVREMATAGMTTTGSAGLGVVLARETRLVSSLPAKRDLVSSFPARRDSESSLPAKRSRIRSSSSSPNV